MCLVLFFPSGTVLLLGGPGNDFRSIKVDWEH